ncbi:MAG: hypothetical protein CBC35_00275 [Planctomycetes bacterium TMED75]|nr:hypothetical protein [Planctomycetaceae bacterium]OUU96886.1 MAG: hypothetical protein CBC35_00275 [Planctomycetes bacterium TMED75]
MKKKAVIWFSIFDWWTSSHGHSDFQLAKKLAEDRPVLFVNSIGMRVPVPGKTQRSGRKILRKLGSIARGLKRPDPALPNLAVMTLVTPPVPVGRLTPVLLLIAYVQIKLVSFFLGWRLKESIVTVPTAEKLARKIVGSRVVYYRSDRHSAFNEAHPSVASSEKKLLENAPIVAYSSTDLMKAESDLVGDRGRMLEHAVDPSLFNPERIPDKKILTYPNPRIGFFGSLRGHSLDLELISEVAKAMPDASILIMGDRSDRADVLDGISNIHFLPQRPHDMMPTAWAALDVALMPYKDTDWMLGVEPIKLREVLAIGVPMASINVLSSNLYPNAIFTARVRSEFIPTVQKAIRSGKHEGGRFKSWSEQSVLLSKWLDGPLYSADV